MYNTEYAKIDGQDVRYWKVNHDCCGNPRYVIHFLTIEKPDHDKHGLDAVSIAYNKAAKKARKVLGGGKYRAKWFGGGIVFRSYSFEEDLKRLMEA